MKLPNFRLHTVQAATSVVVGVAGVVCLLMLTYCVFRGFQPNEAVIPYNAEEGYGRFRNYFVFGFAGLSGLWGLVAGILGFRSIGQRRNERPGLSWIGLLLGAAVVAVSPILLYAWMVMSEPVITGRPT